MKQFAAALRRILLSITMILGLILCVLRPDLNTALGSLLVLSLLGGGALYFVVAIISLLVRLISRKRMDETDQMKDSFMGVLIYLKNGYTLHFFRRLTFWGTIMMIVNIAVFNVTSNMIVDGPYSSNAFLSGYHGFFLWSFIGLIILFVLSLFFWSIYMPHYGEGAYNIFQYTGKLIVNDIMTPINILKSFFKKNEDGSKSKGDVLGLFVMIIFIVVNAIAIIMQL